MGKARPLGVVLMERRRGIRAKASEHLALVIECGGMRAVVAAGMLSLLQERGFSGAFDSVHGSSAGACAACYFLAGQADDGTAIFLHDIPQRGLIERHRLLLGRSPVLTDDIVDAVIFGSRRLESSTLLRTPSLGIVCTDATTGDAVHFSDIGDEDQLSHLLKATLRLPSLSGGAYEFNGHSLVDGGYSAPVALESARLAGATHALVILNQRQADYGSMSVSGLAERLFLRKRFGAAFMERYDASQRVRSGIAAGAYPSSIHYKTLARGEGSTGCSNLETDVTVLTQAYGEGRATMEAFLATLDHAVADVSPAERDHADDAIDRPTG